MRILIFFFALSSVMGVDAQLSKTYENDTISLGIGDTIYFIGSSYEYVSRNMTRTFAPIIKTDCEYGIMLGFKEESDTSLLVIVKPHYKEKNTRFNYYVKFFPAYKRGEISLKKEEYE